MAEERKSSGFYVMATGQVDSCQVWLGVHHVLLICIWRGSFIYGTCQVSSAILVILSSRSFCLYLFLTLCVFFVSHSFVF